MPETSVETQAAASFSAWQIIEGAAVANNCLDDDKLSTWLRAYTVDTIQGKLRFNEQGNFGDTLGSVKPGQNGERLNVWPTARDEPGPKRTPPSSLYFAGYPL